MAVNPRRQYGYYPRTPDERRRAKIARERRKEKERAYENPKLWVTGNGRILTISEMEDDHLVNTIHYLNRKVLDWNRSEGRSKKNYMAPDFCYPAYATMVKTAYKRKLKFKKFDPQLNTSDYAPVPKKPEDASLLVKRDQNGFEYVERVDMGGMLGLF